MCTTYEVSIERTKTVQR